MGVVCTTFGLELGGVTDANDSTGGTTALVDIEPLPVAGCVGTGDAATTAATAARCGCGACTSGCAGCCSDGECCGWAGCCGVWNVCKVPSGGSVGVGDGERH